MLKEKVVEDIKLKTSKKERRIKRRRYERNTNQAHSKKKEKRQTKT